MTSENRITFNAPGEKKPTRYRDCGMVLRSNGAETRYSPSVADDILFCIRTLENETVWMSKDGKEAIGALTELLHDHL